MNHAAAKHGSDVGIRQVRLRDHGVPRYAALPAMTITAPAHDVLRKPVRPDCSTLASEPGRAKRRSQFYTRSDLAMRFYRSFRRYFDPALFQMVEPGAGRGAFLRLLPVGSFGCDIEPMCMGIYTADFLSLEIDCGQRIACIGNPPFGRNAKLAVRFFNYAATFSDVIAFIVPKTFRKTGTINELDDRFHLLHEEIVPDGAFIFEGKPRSVPTVFQIWVRGEKKRAPLPDVKTHPHFKFGSSEGADFAIQRIGKNAGRVHHEMTRSGQAHYFIKGDVEAVMEGLQGAFAKVAQNTAGKPSLAKSEIVAIYSDWLSRCSRRRGTR